MKELRPYYKRNLKLAFPVILSQAGQVIVQQVDTMMVGYVGTNELAASAFANSIFIIGMIVAMGITFGLTPMVGHEIANKSEKFLSRILSNSLILNIFFALIISLFLYIVSYYMQYMGQEEIVVTLSKPYFFSLSASIIPLIIFFTFKQFAEGIGDTKNAMYVTISSNIINIFLNYLLIFGKFGFPEMGLLGAGIATLISRIYMALYIILIFKNNSYLKQYINNFKIRYLEKTIIHKLFKLGLPISIQLLLEILAFALTAIMAGWLGVVPIAAHQIAIGLASISFMIILGIASATTIRISHQYSHKDYDGLMNAAKASIHIVFAFMSFSAIIFLIFRNQLPIFYSQDVEVIKLASTLLIIVAIFQIFDGLQAIMIGILRGFGDVNIAMIYSFIAYIAICLPIGYFLCFEINLGVTGLWVSFIVALGVAGLLFLYRFIKIYNKFKKQILKESN